MRCARARGEREDLAHGGNNRRNLCSLRECSITSFCTASKESPGAWCALCGLVCAWPGAVAVLVWGSGVAIVWPTSLYVPTLCRVLVYVGPVIHEVWRRLCASVATHTHTHTGRQSCQQTSCGCATDCGRLLCGMCVAPGPPGSGDTPGALGGLRVADDEGEGMHARLSGACAAILSSHNNPPGWLGAYIVRRTYNSKETRARRERDAGGRGLTRTGDRERPSAHVLSAGSFIFSCKT